MSFRIKVVPLNKRTEQIARENELITDPVHGDIGISISDKDDNKIYNSALEKIKTDFKSLKLRNKTILADLIKISYGSENNVNEENFNIVNALNNKDILGSLQYIMNELSALIELYDPDTGKITLNEEAFEYSNDLKEMLIKIYNDESKTHYSKAFKDIIGDSFIADLNKEEDDEATGETNLTEKIFSRLQRLCFEAIPEIFALERKITIAEKLMKNIETEIGNGSGVDPTETYGYGTDGTLIKDFYTVKKNYEKLIYNTKCKKFKNYNFINDLNIKVPENDANAKKEIYEKFLNDDFYIHSFEKTEDNEIFKIKDESKYYPTQNNVEFVLSNSNIIGMLKENASAVFDKYFITDINDKNYDGDINIHKIDGIYNLNDANGNYGYDYSSVIKKFKMHESIENSPNINFSTALRNFSPNYVTGLTQSYFYPLNDSDETQVSTRRRLVFDPVLKIANYRYYTYKENNNPIIGDFPTAGSYNSINNLILGYLYQESHVCKNIFVNDTTKLSFKDLLLKNKDKTVLENGKEVTYKLSDYNDKNLFFPTIANIDLNKITANIINECRFDNFICNFNFYPIIYLADNPDYNPKDDVKKSLYIIKACYNTHYNINTTASFLPNDKLDKYNESKYVTGKQNERYNETNFNYIDENDNLKNLHNNQPILVNSYYKSFNPFHLMEVDSNNKTKYILMVKALNKVKGDFIDLKENVFDRISGFSSNVITGSICYPNVYGSDFIISNKLDTLNNNKYEKYIFSLIQTLGTTNGTGYLSKYIDEDFIESTVVNPSTSNNIDTYDFNAGSKRYIATVNTKFTVKDALDSILNNNNATIESLELDSEDFDSIFVE